MDPEDPCSQEITFQITQASAGGTYSFTHQPSTYQDCRLCLSIQLLVVVALLHAVHAISSYISFNLLAVTE